MSDKRTLKQEYRNTPRPFGVLLIRNLTNDKIFLAAVPDINGGINRHRFQLTANGHPNRELQEDWNRLGEHSFAFEILDQMEPLNDPSFDARRELEFLETMWLEKLQPYDERGYNKRKLTREERLRRISAKD